MKIYKEFIVSVFRPSQIISYFSGLIEPSMSKKRIYAFAYFHLHEWEKEIKRGKDLFLDLFVEN